MMARLPPLPRFLLVVAAAVAVSLLVDASSATVAAGPTIVASYQLRTLHTLSARRTIGPAARMQQVRAAQIRLEWPETMQDEEVDTATVRMRCRDHFFETQPLLADSLANHTATAYMLSADAHGAARHAASSIFKVIRGLAFFQGESTTLGPTSSAYVLLHQLPTGAAVSAAIAADPASEAGEFGGWPAPMAPCSGEDDSGAHLLACCNLDITTIDSDGRPQHVVASLAPLQPRDMERSPAIQQAVPPPALDSPSEPRNASEVLLDWKRALHALSSSTPLAQAGSERNPSHLPPSRSTRREFLRAALKRKQLVQANSRQATDPNRKKASQLADDHPAKVQVTAFVEQSGWSTTSLADVLADGVEPGMSDRTRAIIAPTTQDSDAVSHIMTDVTTTFLQAMEQVKVHMKAGVGARQIIALVCNKMVLRDMPPKVGLAIVKSLQQSVLNILKETISDQLTQFLVPPDSVGSFIEKRSTFKPLTEHSIMQDTIQRVREVNPIVADHLEDVERGRVHDKMNEWNEREQKRQSHMEQLVFVETDATVTASPAESPVDHHTVGKSSHAAEQESADDSDDKYTSFLATYSASAIRHAAKVGTSGDAIGQKMKDYLTPMLTHGIIHDASAQLQNVLHVILHESLSNKLHEDISASLITSLTASLTDSISESQVGLLSVTLRSQLTREATHHLTRGLTLLLTPALSLVLTRSLTRSPHADYYCHICANPIDDFPEKPAEFNAEAPEGADPDKPYCMSCEQSKAHEYYMDYYSSYYARYYSSYFSYYYGDFYARKFHEQTLGTCTAQPCEHAM